MPFPKHKKMASSMSTMNATMMILLMIKMAPTMTTKKKDKLLPVTKRKSKK